jgi:hypothetical protein
MPQKKLQDKLMRECTALQQVRLQWEPKNSYCAYYLYNKHNILIYLLEGNRLSRIRLAPQLAAPPMTPPATAFPRKAAPATTTGAILGAGEEEKEGSTLGFIFTLYVVYAIPTYNILQKKFLKLGIQRAVSAALVQIVPLFLAGAHAAGAGRVVARAALGLDLVLGKNEEFTRGQRNGSAFVKLAGLGVVLIADLLGVIARRVFPVGDRDSAVHAVIQGGTVIIRTQHGLLGEGFLNRTSNVGWHASNRKRSATAEQMGS